MRIIWRCLWYYREKYIKSYRNGRTNVKGKRDILRLYREDIMKIDARYRSKVLSIYDQIPGFLSQHENLLAKDFCNMLCIRAIKQVLLDKKSGLVPNIFSDNEVCQLGMTFLSHGRKFSYDFGYNATD